jgi:hypothetical protein
MLNDCLFWPKNSSRPSDSFWIGRPEFTTHFVWGDDKFRWLTSGGWYHNGSETRRFSDSPPSQKIAFHGFRSIVFRLIEHTLVISKGPHGFPGRDVNSIADSLVRAYDHRSSHFHAPNMVKIVYVRDTQRTGECALEDRDDASTAKAHHP